MASRRIGIVVPSLNTIVEDDLRRFLPADIGYHIARLRLRKTAGKVTREALVEAAGEAIEQCTLLADADLDAIAFNCTGASITGGPEGARKLADDITLATSAPATTTALAVVAALRAVGATKIVHICPFAPEFAQDEATFLRDSGFEVVGSRGLGFTDAKVAAQMSPEEIIEIIAATDIRDADAIFLACANVRATEAVAALEARFGKPVIASNQAVIWALVQMVGGGAVLDAGALFDHSLSIAPTLDVDAA
ncbi:maleate cis-trans isomerase family protein [Sphingobium boeckii]|uniref:Maleate isomerase n=1 Tax=Sphingobium boeckii TaxID=1082345 RepID=A0A7W9EFX7_9SPHN|nr:maleate cis-trans isomerase [Sphingobium boeckii]MBB5687738.1 maleate isomerase [Sphingobium boeckii]